MFLVGLAICGLVACTAEDATPIDPANPPTTPLPDPADIPDVSHPLEPTEQMQEFARQQCLDDPELAEGYVSAVDPATSEILVEFSIDCDTVRSSG